MMGEPEGQLDPPVDRGTGSLAGNSQSRFLMHSAFGEFFVRTNRNYQCQ